MLNTPAVRRRPARVVATAITLIVAGGLIAPLPAVASPGSTVSTAVPVDPPPTGPAFETGLPPESSANPDVPMRLQVWPAVVNDDYTYRWEYFDIVTKEWTEISSDDATSTIMFDPTEVGNTAIRVWYGDNADGWAVSQTSLWISQPHHFYREIPGFAPLAVENRTSTRLFLTAWTGAPELPSGRLVLDPWRVVGTSWHWIHPRLNEWFDLRIGNSGWKVRVQYLHSGVDCRFWTSSPDQWTFTGAPYYCLNGAGTDRYVGRGTPDEYSYLTIREH